ncbi:MAG: methylmalonyl-CoA epimerase [candidate division KSB1 bacterium]|nr:methylmalonyl-CoA epimerase [candidate division KSB1 bacterium]MDZ7318337.1 methylmalonyl-CoA epimerase [candidate division KSB1 bacterium]MDZ7342180.1 methylmalonyl-CoA epimerase [candidate division KSB1 bacterium]
MITKIDHIGIAVADLEKQIDFYKSIFGLTCLGIEEIADQKVRVAKFPIGNIQIELLQPIAADSPIAKFLATRGEGIHHIAYQVRDLRGALLQLEAQQIQLIDRQPRTGSSGHLIAFIHPKSTHGVLIELIEAANEE